MTIASDSAASVEKMFTDIDSPIRPMLSALSHAEKVAFSEYVRASHTDQATAQDLTARTAGREEAWDLAIAAAAAAADADVGLIGAVETSVLAAINALDGVYPAWE